MMIIRALPYHPITEGTNILRAAQLLRQVFHYSGGSSPQLIFLPVAFESSSVHSWLAGLQKCKKWFLTNPDTYLTFDERVHRHSRLINDYEKKSKQMGVWLFASQCMNALNFN